jgi:hypothetical protein
MAAAAASYQMRIRRHHPDAGEEAVIHKSSWVHWEQDDTIRNKQRAPVVTL